jgi:hydroxypyruvate isomerase
MNKPRKEFSHDTPSRFLSRRNVLQSAAGALVGAAALAAGRSVSAEEKADKKKNKANKSGKAKKAVKNGNINQSVVQWCFGDHWSVEETIAVAAQLGCKSVELIAPKYFPVLKEYGLQCAIGSIDMSPDPPFVRGFNNPKYRAQVLKATRDSIDACAAHGFKRVISFTGMREDIPDDVGARNCVEGFKQIVGYAEKKGVTLCLEMLNTRDHSHPMKGHPGYQGNHTDYCLDIIKQVGSPNLKLLFDIYHVQIMDGDVIRRIRQNKEYLGHIHTAGNPGRGELDDTQEINYAPIMRALLEVGYDGFVGQEFIPTRDPVQGLTEAVKLCDV